VDKKIRMLNEETIRKISAGEVVERPASVVKELIENSIDAGADSVDVEIGLSAQNLIRVADNGSGMGADDAAMAFKRHATSKIEMIEDLGKITTLGFRGEALASIAAVAQIDLTTKRSSDASGLYMYVESGEIRNSRPAARDRGTTIEVRNLFYNVPARRKFLKKEATETAEIVEVFSRMVLSHPDVGFKLEQSGRCILDAPPGMDIRGRMGLILGEGDPSGMLRVFNAKSYVTVDGFISAPSCTRKDKRGQIFFVNGRYVRNRVLSDALYASYRSLLERGRFPRGVLFITMPPDRVDVNVHPAKLEIKFEEESVVREALIGAVEKGFEQVKAAQNEMQKDPSRADDILSHNDEIPVFKGLHENQTEFNYGPPDENDTASIAVSREDTGGVCFSRRMFQLGGSYIVRTTDEKILITDQHAAHERVLYEFFSKVFSSAAIESQGLLFPLKIDLSSSESAVMDQIIPGFCKLGFDIESFGEKSFIVRGVPPVIKPQHLDTVIKDIISDISASATAKAPGKTGYVEELVKLLSCRAAIKAGDILTEDEMEDLFLQLRKCELPFTCPHGRPINVEINLKELEKRFRRS
jgi:DNA mismatch repair protein MutL